MVDHGILKRILLAYREVSRQVTAGDPVPIAPIAAAAALVLTYIESYHEALEEAYVFPRLQQAGRLTGLVRTLLIQHDRGRHLTAGITELTADGVRTEVARTALTRRLDAFVRMYEPHEAWEDTVVFPAFRDITPERVFAELVALGIGHRDPVMVEAVLLQHADGGGPELGQPPDLGVDTLLPGGEWNAATAAGVDVEMDPVLDRLAFRNDLEPDARPATAGVDDAVLTDPEVLLGQPHIAPVVVPGGEAVRRRFQLVAQRGGPEASEQVWIRAVDDELEPDSHGASSSHCLRPSLPEPSDGPHLISRLRRTDRLRPPISAQIQARSHRRPSDLGQRRLT
jgi:hemerythrin-like domain-containing protein